MDAARTTMGLRVPQDLSVVGFDDVPMSAWASFGLTTIRPRFGEMVEAAAGLALDPGDADAPTPMIEVPADLVIRSSARLSPAPRH